MFIAEEKSVEVMVVGTEPAINAVRQGPPWSPAAIQQAQGLTGKPVKVRVVGNHRVFHAGKAYDGGDTLEVPHDVEHDIWFKAGWVEPVPARSKRASQKGES